SGQMSLAEVMRADSERLFTPAGAASSNFGLTRDTIWLRFDLRAASTMPAGWLLEIGHASLDAVTLYSPEADGRYLARHSGDHLPFNDRAIAHRNHLFALQLQPGQSQRLYLQVKSSGTLAVPVRLWQPAALWHNDQVSYSVLSLYFGLLIGLLIYNLLLYL